MEAKKDIQLVEIFAGTGWQAGMVKSLLEDAGIEAFLKDEIMGTLSPWYTAPGGEGSVKVIISDLDLDKAKLLVEEYEENLKTK
jgi:hypothetical protein